MAWGMVAEKRRDFAVGLGAAGVNEADFYAVEAQLSGWATSDLKAATTDWLRRSWPSWYCYGKSME